MTILGISMSHDGTLTVLENGKNIFSIAEERLNRVKSYMGFPFRALEYVVKNVVKPESIDLVVVGTQSEFPASHKEMFAFILNEDKKYYDFQNQAKPKDFYINDTDWESITTDEQCKQYVLKKLKSLLGKHNITAPIQFVNHHLSHAAAAYFASGYKEALSVTVDAYGDGLCSSVYICKGTTMEKIHEEPFYNSIGTLYSEVTKACGFKMSRHEGKITGLAAYGDPKKSEQYFDTCTRVTDGNFEIKLAKNDLLSKAIRVTGNYLVGVKETRATRIIRDIRKKLSDADLAAGVQLMLEKRLVEYISYWQKKTGMHNLAVCGGVFANVKANQRVSEIKEIDNLFVYPDMGDGGNAYGAAAYTYYSTQNNTPAFSPLKDVYFGPSYSAALIEDYLKQFPQVQYKKSAEVEKETAALVHGNKIVGWFQGGMEYGPRALGNRSIVASPTDATINKWLNDRLKRTEFMPFAPSCLYEYADILFNIPKEGFKYPAMFMTITFDMKEEWVKKAPAVAHIDKTARPQLVTEQSNLKYYNLLKEYHKISGLPLLINTSFNVHEEPIVCSPEDGVKPLLSGVIDYLVIDDFICSLK